MEIDNFVGFIYIIQNSFISNNVNAGIISVSNSFSLNLEEITLQNTNLYTNDYTYLFTKFGGCILCVNVYAKNFSKLTLIDNISYKTAVGMKLIDKTILSYNSIYSIIIAQEVVLNFKLV